MYFGWLCMSWRQPAANAADTKDTKVTKDTKEVLIRNSGYLSRAERLEEPARPLEVEPRILGFDAEKEPVAARQREPRHVEDRVIRLRQTVQRHQITRRSSSTFASGRMVRISKIEIIGRNRRNRNSSDRNNPIVPTNVAQSHRVGA